MQWLMLALTFIVMALLERLSRGAPVEAQATLALGFLTLAAYLAGTLAQRRRLPRISGYLLAGFIAGPSWFNLVTGDALHALGAISSGALALIAFAVGSELSFDAWRGPPERRVALARIVAGAMGGPFLAVTLVVLTVSPWFFLTAHQPFGDALAVALTLGTLAATASPTFTWAVTTDLGAEGPLSRTTLDVTIAQDLAAVLLLIVLLAVMPLFASHGAVTPGIASHTILIVAGSLAVGIALGFAAPQYLRVIHGGLAWVLPIFAFLVSQAVRLAGLDAVLVALAAGCTLRNAAPAASERVRTELKRCALPVYVVFFALAGSSLQLDVLVDIWPWVLLLAALRVVYLRYGLRWASRQSALAAGYAEYGWLGLISQGGLAVTLAAVLRRAFPEWNVSLETLVIAMIGVHQLAGPICFQWALRRTGEIPAGEGGGRADVGNTHQTPASAAGAAVVVSGSGSSM